MADADLVHVQALGDDAVVGALLGEIAPLHKIPHARLAAALLIRGGGGDDGALQGDARLLQGPGGDELGDDAALLVGATPCVDVAVLDLAAVGVGAPASALRHHVIVAGEVDVGPGVPVPQIADDAAAGQTLAVGGQLGKPLLRHVHELHLHADPLHPPGDGGGALQVVVPRRVLGGDGEDVAGQGHQLLPEALHSVVDGLGQFLAFHRRPPFHLISDTTKGGLSVGRGRSSGKLKREGIAGGLAFPCGSFWTV